jgi:maleylpyruvate isomerase
VPDDSQVDPQRVKADIDALEASQTRLVEHLRSLEAVDPATPSLLPGWSIGHVMTHIARNADSTLRMLAGLRQYWKGPESRRSDIELGAGRGWNELVDDVDATNLAVIRRMREYTDWQGTIETTSATRPATMLPHLRRREVEIHHVDLGLGFGFEDMPHDYVRAETRLLEMMWKARQPMGLTPLPEAVLALPEHTRLEWLVGRRSIDGVADAGVF